MFDYVRKHTKIMMGLLFLLIIPSFVLFGIDGYKRSQEKGRTVARIGSHEITQAEWDAAHKMEVDRLRAAMPTLDPALLDSPQSRYATLERLVRDRVQAQAAESSRLLTSDARLARELQANPAIAALRRADGSLDVERYRQLVGSQGMTPEMFEARVRSDLSTRQVEAGITQSGLSTPALAELALRAFFERREVQVARFAVNDFASQVNPTEAELETYYQANLAQFQAPEQASIEYVMLDLQAVKKGISLSEADLKSYYEQNAARLSGTEERRASHILLAAAKDAMAEREKARAKAEELLAALRKAPDSFAELARKHSQDPGSAAQGGDLDFFARGAMVKPFEDAVFSLKKGEISAVVESDFGFHIIKLTDIKAPKQKSFDELRASLEADLKTQQAQRKYAEAAEAFTNGVYEQSDSLKPVAERLKLDVLTARNVQRQPAAGATGVLANPKFLAAVFSADAVEKKRNTEAVETAPNQLVSARITEHTPARTLPLAEVHQVVRQRVVAARAAELARQEGARKLAAWQADASNATLPAALVVSREQSQSLPVPLLDAILRADASKLPAWVGVDLGSQGYAVARVNKLVERPAPAPERQKQEQGQYAQAWTAAESQAYGEWLKTHFKAQIKVPRPGASAE